MFLRAARCLALIFGTLAAAPVHAAASNLRTAPHALTFAGPSAAPANATIRGGTPPYAVSGCSGVATPVISAHTLTVTPVAVGSCGLSVTDAASAVATVLVSVDDPTRTAPTDNLTYHKDATRTGWYDAETALTSATVGSSSFGLLTTLTAPTFGKVYGQPLFVTNHVMPDGTTRDLVIVGTAKDQLYAFDATTDAVVWHRDFTNAALGVRQQSYTDSGCGDVNPDVGITGTPVIDRKRNLIYLVVPTVENGTPFLRLHAVSLGTGNDVLGPTVVSASAPLVGGGSGSVDPIFNFPRAALLEASGNVYVSLGTHCDFDTTAIHGWLLGYSADTLAPIGDVLTTDQADSGNNFIGGVWMAGYGPAADAQGNIFFATGNGAYNGTTDFSMSVVRLPNRLGIAHASFFTPYLEAGDSDHDLDLGSGGVMLLPTLSKTYPHLLVAGGKCGFGAPTGTTGCQKYLLNRDALGGKQPNDAGALWHADTGGMMFGGPAYFADASGTGHVVYGDGTPISTYDVSFSPIGLVVRSSANVGCLECRNGGSAPVVSSNGTQAGTAVVWVTQDGGESGGSLNLYAFDAMTMTVLFHGTAGMWTKGGGASYVGGAFVSPLVANGRVYVPVQDGVAVFGLASGGRRHGGAAARPRGR